MNMESHEMKTNLERSFHSGSCVASAQADRVGGDEMEFRGNYR